MPFISVKCFPDIAVDVDVLQTDRGQKTTTTTTTMTDKIPKLPIGRHFLFLSDVRAHHISKLN